MDRTRVAEWPRYYLSCPACPTQILIELQLRNGTKISIEVLKVLNAYRGTNYQIKLSTRSTNMAQRTEKNMDIPPRHHSLVVQLTRKPPDSSPFGTEWIQLTGGIGSSSALTEFVKAIHSSSATTTIYANEGPKGHKHPFFWQLCESYNLKTTTARSPLGNLALCCKFGIRMVLFW
jgi:hypothetical protein